MESQRDKQDTVYKQQYQKWNFNNPTPEEFPKIFLDS